jgi:hypothetical protein
MKMQNLALKTAADHLQETAESLGVTLETGSGLDRLKVLADRAGRVVAVPFCDAAPDDVFWVAGIQNGEVVHLQAFLRCCDVGSLDVMIAAFWRRHHAGLADGAVPARALCLAPMTHRAAPVAVYHGDLWIRAGVGNCGLVARLGDVLPKLGIFLACIQFAPDLVFGIVEPRKVMTGLAARWGYSRMQPGVLRWSTPPPDLPRCEWLVLSTADDIAHLAREITEWGLPTLAGWKSHI